jgi:hypothetical protein
MGNLLSRDFESVDSKSFCLGYLTSKALLCKRIPRKTRESQGYASVGSWGWALAQREALTALARRGGESRERGGTHAMHGSPPPLSVKKDLTTTSACNSGAGVPIDDSAPLCQRPSRCLDSECPAVRFDLCRSIAP